MSYKSNTKVMRVIAITMISFLLFSTLPLFSATTTSSNVKLIGSSSPEAKVEVGYNVSFPFLQGTSMLTSNNNIKIKSILGISPIAVTAQVDAVLTPLAIMEVSLGAAVGTGWDFNAFGLDLQGIRLGPTKSPIPEDSDQLGGSYLKGRAGVALQFDTGAVLEGEWKSILLRTYHEINYQMYTGTTGADEWWEYENGGVKENDFAYKGEYVIGYNMPLMINTVALMLEHTVDSVFVEVADRKEYDQFVLGLIANVKLFDNLNLTVIPQVYLDRGSDCWKRLAAMVNYTF